MNSIVLNDIKKEFTNELIFKKYNLSIKKGSFVIISGPSGSGKTTLLNIIGGLEKVDSGSVIINGKKKIKPTRLYRNNLTYLFQNFLLINDKTVKYNLLIPLKYKRMRKKDKINKINEVLDMVGLRDSLSKTISSLSGGQKQRIALARAILMDNNIILADEPTGSLDDENAQIVMKLLKDENDNGKTVVLVTHDKRLFSFADHIEYIGL